MCRLTNPEGRVLRLAKHRLDGKEGSIEVVVDGEAEGRGDPVPQAQSSDPEDSVTAAGQFVLK